MHASDRSYRSFPLHDLDIPRQIDLYDVYDLYGLAHIAAGGSRIFYMIWHTFAGSHVCGTYPVQRVIAAGWDLDDLDSVFIHFVKLPKKSRRGQ